MVDLTEDLQEKKTLFWHALIDETLSFLPKALEFKSGDQFQSFLVKELPQNSEYVRRMYARIITNRFFSQGRPFRPLAQFIGCFGGDSAESREVLFFELLLREPSLRDVCKKFFSKRVGSEASRREVEGFLIQSRGTSGEMGTLKESVKKQAKIIVHVLIRLGRIEVKKRGFYNVKSKKPTLPVFLYVLHRLYPKPGMYKAEEFLNDGLLDALMWNRSGLKDLLYEAWRKKYLAKVSEIDQYFHFSTRYSLTDFMERVKNEDTADM